MNTDKTPALPAPRDSGEFQIASMEQIGPHTYKVTTESRRYGRVTQDVACFPESIFVPEGHRRERDEAVTGYRTDEHG